MCMSQLYVGNCRGEGMGDMHIQTDEFIDIGQLVFFFVLKSHVNSEQNHVLNRTVRTLLERSR